MIDDPQYMDVVKTMRRRLPDWMLETRDPGILDETETLLRPKSHASHREPGLPLDNDEQMLETAYLQFQGTAATSE